MIAWNFQRIVGTCQFRVPWFGYPCGYSSLTKLGAIAGITGFKKAGSRYSGADFPAELLVFSGINSSQMDIFLAEYKKAGIEPIGCKAVVTPDNVFWSADKLFREIFREHLFMSR